MSDEKLDFERYLFRKEDSKSICIMAFILPYHFLEVNNGIPRDIWSDLVL